MRLLPRFENRKTLFTERQRGYKLAAQQIIS